MDKKIIKEKVDWFCLDWFYGVTLKKIKEDIESLELDGVTDIDISEGDGFIKTTLYKSRLETDEELDSRLSLLKSEQEKIKELELKELARLIQKYITNGK